MNFDYSRYYLRGWLFHFFGRDAAAYDAYALAFAANPQCGKTARHLAAIAAEKKDYAASEKWFEATLRVDGEDANSWFNLGYVRDRAGKKKEAIAAFDEAIRLAPSLDRAWYGRGLAQAAVGNHAAAAEALREAVRLQPMNGVAYYQLGMACHHLHDPAKVEETIAKLAEFDPTHARQLMRDSERLDLLHLLPEPLR